MKRALPLAIVAGLAVGATALAQGTATRTTRPSRPSPLAAAQAPRLRPGLRLGAQRDRPAHPADRGDPRLGPHRVDDRQAARLTGVPRAASATVRIPQSGARLSVSAETLGGQRLRSTRVYSDCTRPPDTGSGGTAGVGGGGEG